MDERNDSTAPEMSSEPPAPDPAVPAAEEPRTSERLDDWTRVRALALKQLDRFMSFEPKVLRGDDPDAIHDMRVASRRLQQVLDLLYPQPRPKEVQRLRRRIRRCRRSLGEVRNCDVMLQYVEKPLGRKRSARREAWTAVKHYLLERRSESFVKATRKMSKVNLAVFYVHMKELLLTPPAPQPHGYHEAADAAALQPTPLPFPERIAEALTGVWNAFVDQISLSHRDSSGPVIHGARIAAKRVRYLLEVVREFEVAGSAEALAWLRRLQQHLGEWHDLEVLELMTVDMLARPAFLREHLPLAMEVEKLILRNRETKKEFEEKYFRMTRDSMEWQRLKDWVDYLLASPSAAFTRG